MYRIRCRTGRTCRRHRRRRRPWPWQRRQRHGTRQRVIMAGAVAGARAQPIRRAQTYAAGHSRERMWRPVSGVRDNHPRRHVWMAACCKNARLSLRSSEGACRSPLDGGTSTQRGLRQDSQGLTNHSSLDGAGVSSTTPSPNIGANRSSASSRTAAGTASSRFPPRARQSIAFTWSI